MTLITQSSFMPPKSDILKSIQSLVAPELIAVNKVMVEAIQSTTPLIPQLGHHLIAAGGKRIRPLITLLSAKMCGDLDGARAIKLAACVEFIHGATLLHDDVVDESALRRGLATAHAVWGNKASVLVGDFLFARAFQLMVADGSLDVLKILSEAAARIVEGEVQQLSYLGSLSLTSDTYLQVIGAKTAPLFEAAAMVGAVICQQSCDQVQALGRFGRALGMIFQIQDDVLDYLAGTLELGKSSGDDFREGKVTLPVILAYHKGSVEEKDFWQRTLESRNQQPKDFDQALAYLAHHRVYDDIYCLMETYSVQAQTALQMYHGSYQQAMLGLATYCLERPF